MACHPASQLPASWKNDPNSVGWVAQLEAIDDAQGFGEQRLHVANHVRNLGWRGPPAHGKLRQRRLQVVRSGQFVLEHAAGLLLGITALVGGGTWEGQFEPDFDGAR